MKLECINHVSKRLGTAFKDLKAKSGAQGKPIGGRGKLTYERIKLLTGHYGKEIKDSKGDFGGWGCIGQCGLVSTM